MRTGLDKWHWQCDACGYEAADLVPAINEASRHSLVDEAGRGNGLRALREQNFRDLLHLISRHLPQGQHKLLDVGAAHGWFVKMASGRFEALGIEPDHAVCQKAREQGIPLLEGYFPEVLSSDDRFDIIVFNDVLEHIPDVGQTLKACSSHLTDGGLLVLNLPSSNGFFYKTSRILRRLGSSGAFERMWQKGLPSPHLHYFNTMNLIKLTEQHGFEQACVADLPSIRFAGLYDRIAYVGGTGRLHNLLTYLAVAMSIPFIKQFDSDIAVIIVRKNAASADK